jgi:hypothetical protein
MDKIKEIQAIISTQNQAKEHYDYAKQKANEKLENAQKWQDIAKSLEMGYATCQLLLNKEYVMNLHNLVQKQEEISTQEQSQPFASEEKEAENIQEPSVVEQEIQDEELSEENVDDCATTKESELSKEVEVNA